MNRNFTRFAFAKSVKNAQERYGSRTSYTHMEESGDRYVLTGNEKAFIESRDSFYLATVGENGYDWNCPQHITPRYTAEEIGQGMVPS